METLRRYRPQLLLALLTAMAYGVALRCGFLWDDERILSDLANGTGTLADAFSLEFFQGGDYFRPLTALSLILDHLLWGTDPFGFHLTNVLLHLLAVLAVFGLLRSRFGASAAFWAAALFAVHPVNTEAVTPAFSRTCLLEAFFLPALWLAIRPARSRWNDFFAAVFFVLALAAKQSAVVLPAIVTAFYLLFPPGERPPVRSKTPLLLLLWGIALAFVVVYFGFVPRTTQALSPLTDASLPVRAWTFLEAIARYLGLWLFPLNLHMEHLFVSSLASPLPWLGLGILAAGLGFGWRWRRANPNFLFGLLWFLIALAPVSNLLIVLPTPMAERWLYLPSVGLLWIVADALRRFARGAALGRVPAVALSAVLLLLVARTVDRNLDWKDGPTLYSHDVQAAPGSFLLNNNLGVLAFRAGDFAEAERYFRRAHEIEPRYGMTINNLGAALERRGALAEAETLYREAVRVAGYPLTYANLAKLLHRKGDRAGALETLRAGHEKYPREGDLKALLDGIAAEGR